VDQQAIREREGDAMTQDANAGSPPDNGYPYDEADPFRYERDLLIKELDDLDGMFDSGKTVLDRLLADRRGATPGSIARMLEVMTSTKNAKLSMVKELVALKKTQQDMKIKDLKVKESEDAGATALQLFDKIMEAAKTSNTSIAAPTSRAATVSADVDPEDALLARFSEIPTEEEPEEGEVGKSSGSTSESGTGDDRAPEAPGEPLLVCSSTGVPRVVDSLTGETLAGYDLGGVVVTRTAVGWVDQDGDVLPVRD
jgi:hypothetical protein